MGPLSGRPPVSTRRTRESIGGGGAGEWSEMEMSGMTMSSARRVSGASPGPERERVSGSNATWMRRLEERYQRLHKKIATIPTCNTSASRFNFLTRRFFNETVAKTQQRRPTVRRPDTTTSTTNDNDDTQEDKEEGEEKEEVEEEREDGVRRKANTAPELRGRTADSQQTEELLDQPALLSADHDTDSERDLNDENWPPSQQENEEGGGEREPGEEEEEEEVEEEEAKEKERGGGREGRGGGLASLSVCVHCGAPVSPTSTGALLFKPTLRATLSLDDVSHRLRRAPLLERDNKRQGAARPAALQALAQRGARKPPPARTQQGQAPRQRSANPHSLCRRCAKHGLGTPTVLSALPATHAVLGTPGGGGRRDKRGSESGPNGGWIKGDTGDVSGVQALNPVSGSGCQMYGGVMGPGQAASHYSHSTTKSCPAALASSQPPSAPRRRRNGGSGAGRQEIGHQKMQVFAHMSVEARHAITETLKEMGQQDAQEDQQQCVEDSTPSPDNDPPPPPSQPSTQPLPASSQHQPSVQPPPPSRRPGPSSTQANPRAPSLSASQRTGPRPRPQPRTAAAARQAGDATSSVTATVKGCRSPRRPTTTRKAPSSTVQTSQPRAERLKSARTLPDDQRYSRTYDDEQRNGNDINDDDEKDVDEALMDVFSIASTANVSSNFSSPELQACGGPGLVAYRTHLPAITSRTEPHAQGSLPGNDLRHVNYRIRGVGSYRVARERTFEITAPDFDIRYRDVITCQKGDRDTPPPDIFEKSVGKVRDWLNKYFFTS